MRRMIGLSGNGENRGASLPTNLSFRLIKLLSVLFIIGLLIFPAHGSQLEVCRVNCEYAGISSAVEAASSGDRLMVNPGTYRENVTIDKSMEIAGTEEGQVVIVPEKDGSPALTVKGSEAEVRLEKLTVKSSSGAPVDRQSALYPDGLSVRESARLELSNVIVADNEECGLRAMEDSAVTITGSSFSQNGKGVCLQQGSKLSLFDTRISGNGLVLSDTASARVNGSSISNHRGIGLELKGNSRIEVRGSRISTCETCVSLKDESSMVLASSIVQDAGDGIRLLKNSDIRVSNSEFTDCTSGLDLRENAGALIRGSKITSNDHGLSLFNQSALDIKDSRIAYNDIGIRAKPEADARVTGCNVRFYNNSQGHVAGLEAEVTSILQDRCDA